MILLSLSDNMALPELLKLKDKQSIEGEHLF